MKIGLGNYEPKVKETIEIKNLDGKVVYFEDTEGNWFIQEFDENGNRTHFENNHGQWSNMVWDVDSHMISYQSETDALIEWGYDDKGRLIKTIKDGKEHIREFDENDEKVK